MDDRLREGTGFSNILLINTTRLESVKKTHLTCALGAKATRLPILGLPPPKLIV